MKKWLSVCAVAVLALMLGGQVQAQEIKAETSTKISKEEMQQVIDYVKEKDAAGELETEEGIRAAIEEGEEKFRVNLTEEEVQRIISLVNKLKGMGMDSEYLTEQAEKLYEKYGADIVERANEAATEAVDVAVESATKSFWESLKESAKEFWNNIRGLGQS